MYQVTAITFRWLPVLGRLAAAGALVVLTSCAYFLPPAPAPEPVAAPAPAPEPQWLTTDEVAALFADTDARALPDGGSVIIRLPGASFEFGSSRLSNQARSMLGAVARRLNVPGVERRLLAIEGHTDSTGPADYNLILSEKRAESVRQELLFNGVHPDRMQVRGLGSQAPIASNGNQEGRAENRRVDIVVQATAIE